MTGGSILRMSQSYGWRDPRDGRPGWDLRYWLSPLPAAGVLRFGLNWPEAEIEDSWSDVDVSALHEAAQRGLQRWP